MKKLVLIDGNSIINRAFYGIMGNKMLMTEDGTYTNAVYGFLAILFKIVDLPAPFGPINVRISPLFSEKSIFSISGLLSYPTASFSAVK